MKPRLYLSRQLIGEALLEIGRDAARWSGEDTRAHLFSIVSVVELGSAEGK